MSRALERLCFASIFAGMVGVGLSCTTGQSTLPPIDAPPQPPHPRPVAEAEQTLSQATTGQVGKFREAPSPRFGVAIFAFPRDKASTEAAYSPESTARIVNQLDWNHLSAVAVDLKDRTLTEDVEKGAANLGKAPEASLVDILIVGTILPGGNIQARVAAFDPKPQRFVGKSEFEGGDEEAVIRRALDEALSKVNHYWVELRRGEDAEATLEVMGFRYEPDIAIVLEKLGAIPNVHVTRHEATYMNDGFGSAGYHLYFQGEPEAILREAAQVQWKTGSRSARLARVEGFRFKAVYAE